MDDAELHYPPGAEPETPQETPREEEKPQEEPKDTTPEAPKEEAPKDEPKDEEKPTDEPPKPTKKRSIYDDLKDRKHELKEALSEKETLANRVTELEALLAKKADAPNADEKSDVDDEIAAFAEKQGLDPQGLKGLTDIILKRVPKVEMPEGLSKEELADWRQSRARMQRTEEDNAIFANAPTVKSQLKISDDAELANVMKEVVRLSHTPEFHDKEVEYIVWKKQADLAKLVSPKRPSFEAGGNGPEGKEVDIDFSNGAKVTPEMLSKEMTYPKATYEIRKSQ